MAETKRTPVSCTFETFLINAGARTVNFKAKLTGSISSGEVWNIPNASTVVEGKDVELEDFAKRVLIGWFWVRKVQDVLRRGTKQDALDQLEKGFKWGAKPTRIVRVVPKTPEQIVDAAKAVEMSKADMLQMIKDLQKLAKDMD